MKSWPIVKREKPVESKEDYDWYVNNSVQESTALSPKWRCSTLVDGLVFYLTSKKIVWYESEGLN